MKLTKHIALRYIGMTSIVLIISVPVFYFILQRIMWNNIDEDLQSQRHWIENQLQKTSPENFVSFNNNILIRRGQFSKNERLSTEKLYVSYDNEIVPYRIIEFNTTANGEKYAVRIQKSLIESEDILRAIVTMQLSVLLILLAVLVLINRNLNHNVWKPFYKTLDALKKYRIDRDEFINLPNVPINELNDLNQSLNELTKHNREIFTAQKEFTENASHELQTPLAIIQSNLDLLWQTSPLSKEQANLIQNLTENNIRISNLNKSLLLLAKIDNKQFTDVKPVDIALLTEKIMSRFCESFVQSNITLSQQTSLSATVFADETLMEILISNLISNTLRYTPTNGTVDINITHDSFKIGNTAINSKPLDSRKLFRRFQKQEESTKNSIGVGLEICRRICIQYGFDIQYKFSEGKHWFEVKF
jgi:signal transduction histidine kinase